MKTIICLHCEEQFSGETPHDVQMAMLPHYKETHAEIMASNTEESKKEWFKEFDRRWDEAKELPIA